VTTDPAVPSPDLPPPSGIRSEPGTASGIGSWPGTDPMYAARIVMSELGEAPAVPYLPELPARGPGADLIGRAAALLVEMPVDLQPSGWRLVDHPGRDLNRARAFLRQDLDVLAEVTDGWTGRLKLQVAGPWTLASSLWLPRLERSVVDPGAVRDLIGSLAEGVRRHVQEVARLVPGAQILVQLDEPGISAVLAGSLPTASGFGRLRAMEEPVVVDGLSAVLAAAREAGAAGTVLHSCAGNLPIGALARTGVDALSLDLAQLGQAGWEELAPVVEGGTQLWAGAVPTDPAALGVALPRPDRVADAVWTPWRRLGLDAATAASVVITPACGLAGALPPVARGMLRLVREAAAVLAERAAG
jgi:methionine synthase II (cobalamin-independent)